MKKSLIFIFILVILFNIACVGAADLNMSNDVQDVNDEILGVDNENIELSESHESFAKLNETINLNQDENVYLNENYTYQNDDVEFINGIEFMHDVTIHGNGYTINGSNQARAFHIYSNFKVTFINITFVD